MGVGQNQGSSRVPSTCDSMRKEGCLGCNLGPIEIITEELENCEKEWSERTEAGERE